MSRYNIIYKNILRSYALVLTGLVAGLLPAQGSVRNGIYVDPALGFQCKVPGKWRQIPTQVDERWVVAQFQSHLQYQGHAKLDGYTRGHRPMMRVIRFDKRLLSRTPGVVTRNGHRMVSRIRLPYRDYRDYVRRNRKQGGFFFSVEKRDQKLGGRPVDIYEVQVEKLARGGRRHCIAYVFQGSDVDFAVEFEFLEHRFRKLKPLAMRSFLSFKMIPRTASANGVAEDEDYLAVSEVRFDGEKASASERRAWREQVAERRARRAMKGLPRGWKVTASESFTILSSASRRHTSRLARAAEACRKHLDQRLSSLSEEYVPNGIVRVCEDAGVYAAYRTRSSAAFS